jgi:hypothetical protein
MEFVVADHGRDPKNGERMMDGFMTVYPEGGPSVIQNTEDGRMTVSLIVRGEPSLRRWTGRSESASLAWRS